MLGTARSLSALAAVLACLAGCDEDRFDGGFAGQSEGSYAALRPNPDGTATSSVLSFGSEMTVTARRLDERTVELSFPGCTAILDATEQATSGALSAADRPPSCEFEVGGSYGSVETTLSTMTAIVGETTLELDVVAETPPAAEGMPPGRVRWSFQGRQGQ